MIRHKLRAIWIGEPCMVASTRGPVWYIATVTQALRGWGYGYPVRAWIEKRTKR